MTEVELAHVYERRFDLVNKKWSKQWSLELVKKSEVIALVKQLRPFMGKRRREKIDEIIALEV